MYFFSLFLGGLGLELALDLDLTLDCSERNGGLAGYLGGRFGLQNGLHLPAPLDLDGVNTSQLSTA